MPYSTVHPSITPSRKVLSKRQEDNVGVGNSSDKWPGSAAVNMPFRYFRSPVWPYIFSSHRQISMLFVATPFSAIFIRNIYICMYFDLFQLYFILKFYSENSFRLARPASLEARRRDGVHERGSEPKHLSPTISAETDTCTCRFFEGSTVARSCRLFHLPYIRVRDRHPWLRTSARWWREPSDTSEV